MSQYVYDRAAADLLAGMSAEHEPDDDPQPAPPAGLSDDELLARCPAPLRDYVATYPPYMRHVVLTASLPVLASAMPHYLVRYGHDLGPHLYVFAYGDRGSGKGFVRELRGLVADVDEMRREQNAGLANDYERAMLDYELAVKAYKKDASNDLPDKPEPPPNRGLFVPGNASGAAIYKRIASNQDGALIIETEAVTLVNALSKEYGGFRGDLCAAYHCEPMTSARTTTESHHVESPRLSILLAGTGGALRRLLPDPEDGLLSRFVLARVLFSAEFVDPMSERFNGARDGAEEALRRRVTTLFRDLDARAENPARFALTDAQKARWLAEYRDAKRKVIAEGERERSGELHRNALAVVRAAMILAALRRDPGADVHHASDDDFAAAMELGRRWWSETCAVLDRQASEGAGLNDQHRAYYEALPAAFTTAEAKALAKVQEVAERTAMRWLAKWSNPKANPALLKKTATGGYAKPAQE